MIPAGSIAAQEACRVMGARTCVAACCRACSTVTYEHRYTSLVMNDLHAAVPVMPTEQVTAVAAAAFEILCSASVLQYSLMS